MADKCAHPPCLCTIAENGDYGKYCSAICQMKGETTEPLCECGHPPCRV
jgi:hypothetical protein